MIMDRLRFRIGRYADLLGICKPTSTKTKHSYVRRALANPFRFDEEDVTASQTIKQLCTDAKFVRIGILFVRSPF